MRKMDMLPVNKRFAVWHKLEYQQPPDDLAEREQFGNLTSAKTLRDAAVIHCRYLFADPRVWEKALEMRDNIITELDWEWPHVAFWDEVEKLVPRP